MVSLDSLTSNSYWPSLLVSPPDGTECLQGDDECKPTMVYPSLVIHRETLLLSLSLFIQQWAAYLTYLGLFVRWEVSVAFHWAFLWSQIGGTILIYWHAYSLEELPFYSIGELAFLWRDIVVNSFIREISSPVDWGCRGLRHSHNECHDITLNCTDGEAQVLELWVMWIPSSLSLLLDSPWYGKVVGWLGFYGISTFGGYLKLHSFLYNTSISNNSV